MFVFPLFRHVVGMLLMLIILMSTTNRYCVNAFRPPSLAEEIGCSPTLTAIRDLFYYYDDNYYTSKRLPVYFDPFRLADDENFARFRESELKHGRVCMLAMLEYMSIPLLKRFNIPDIVPSDFPEGMVSSILSYTIKSDYVKVLITCAVLETLIFIQREPQSLPGDYGTGYWGIRDKGLHETELIIELEHGRLSMIAFTVALILEIVTDGKAWTEQWISFLKYWVQQF